MKCFHESLLVLVIVEELKGIKKECNRHVDLDDNLVVGEANDDMILAYEVCRGKGVQKYCKII